MEPIIRAASVASVPRQLRRPVTAVSSNLPERQDGQGTAGRSAGQQPSPPSGTTPQGQTPGAPAHGATPGQAQGQPQGNPQGHTPATPQHAPKSAPASATAFAPAPNPALRSYGASTAQAAVPPAASPVDESKAVYERELNRLAEAQQQQQSAQNLQLQKQRELELQQARAAAEKLGFTEGLEQGAKAAQEVLQQHVAQLGALMAQLNQTRRELVERSEDTMVEIVYEALCRIAAENVGQKAMVLGMVQKVLTEFRQHEPLVLLLHPQDLALVQHALPELGIDPEQTQLRADSSLKMGGCMIESAAGTLDASLETQFSRLREALLQVRRGEEYAGEVS